MTKEVIVDDDALEELARGVEWYESERFGLGDDLIEEVDAVLSALPSGTLRPTKVAVQRKGVSVLRVLVGRFPYSVIYIDGAERIDVIAIAHARSLPLYWQGRLRRVLRPTEKKT